MQVLEQLCIQGEKEIEEISAWGTWAALSVKHLPLVQVMIPGAWD